MPIRHVFCPVLLCSFIVIATPAGVAHAQETSAEVEGRAHFKRAVEFFKEGDFRTALIEFKRAYELAPNYKVLYNLGQTSLELQDYAAALRSFERYLADGGKDIAPPRRAQVEADIDKLRKRVARVEVTTNVADAEILLDDVSVGRTPLPGPLAVSAGRRKISATKGGITAQRVIDVVGGDATSLALEIVDPTKAALDPTRAPEPATRPAGSAEPQRVAAARTSPSAAPDTSSGRTGLWLGISATGVLAAGAVATGVLALGAKRDFDSTVARYGVDPSAVDDARSKTRTFALATDILAGAALVVGGITIIAAATGGKETAKTVRLDVVPGGLVAAGRF